jgi:DNA-binding response OmpR family regulator
LPYHRGVRASLLVIEDEHSVGDLVRRYFEHDGFQVVWVRTGEDGLAAFDAGSFECVILDLGLPGIDGFEVCRELRSRSRVPVVMLTAWDGEPDRVAGLEVGADDYVTKPFSPRELVARVKAVLRRVRWERNQGSSLSVGEIQLDQAAREASNSGRPLELTAREFDLLACLMEHPGVVLSRERLLERVWGSELSEGTRTVDVHVAQLRRKLEDPGLIRTVRGKGYKLVAPYLGIRR